MITISVITFVTTKIHTLLHLSLKISYLCYMNMKTETYRKPLILLIIGSIVVRGLIASFTELGNDEVYYRIFGLFPSLSYFDHAPMVAWLINLTTAGSELASEFLVRLSSILIGALNTYIIYLIAGRGRTGFIAALLLTGSIYASLIVGTFIMPDTPMSFFWLLTLLIFKDILINKEPKSNAATNKKMLLAGLTIGLAMLSKYTGIYLWAAAVLYILIYNRKWLRNWSLYVAPMISLVVFSPVLIWNYQNDFISFTFHSSRVVAENSINPLYFGRELFGGVFYNNPINFILIICTIIAYLKRKTNIDRPEFHFAMLFSVPMIVLFLAISLTRETLPHWAAPAYFILIPLTAKWLNKIKSGIKWAWASVILASVVCVVGFVQINWGILPLTNKNADQQELGQGDITLDMYGWTGLGQKFGQMLDEDKKARITGDNPLIINYRWDESAHLDTYVALPLGLDLITFGELGDTHFYESITAKRTAREPMQALRNRGGYLIVSSRYFRSDLPIFKHLSIDSKQIDRTITVMRSGDCAVNFFVYRIAPIKS